ncbi:MAG: sulfite exporter TauE/SafE family protein [Candidatus Methylomirabilales bacterium]
MLYPSLLLLAAFGGSLHCLGMCGGFVAAVNALSKSPSIRSLPLGLLGHLLYHGGRLASYMFLGALAGSFGQVFANPAPFLHRLIDLSAGLFILAIGLRLLGFLPPLHPVKLAGGEALVKGLFASLLGLRPLRAALSLGLFNGLIPCPLIAAFLAHSASTGSALGGALTMAILVVGTAPGMLLLGRVALTHETRWRAIKAAGALLSLLGTITLLHAVGVVPSVFGSPH